MKIIKQVINFRKKVFAVKVNLEKNSDDIWNLFNLMNINDYITGTVTRRVKQETNQLVKTENRTFTVTLKVKSYQYDTNNDTISISGENATESRHLGLGQQQAMHIGPPMAITLVKKEFDSMHVHRLQQIKKDDEAGHIIAITMEEGIANIFMISQHKTVSKGKITKSVAKRTVRNESKHEKK